MKKVTKMNIGIKGDQLLVDENGDKFVDLLSDLGWDYQRMSCSGREVYDEIQQLLGGLPENEVWMEI